MLLVDSCNSGGIVMNLNESAIGGLTKFRGKFQQADEVNKNNRSYGFSVLDKNVQELVDCVNARGLVGELDHPSDSIIHFEKASHVVTKLWWEGKTLMGEGEILNTPHGKILKALINDGVRVGISSRGVGNGTTNEKGVLMITESYKLITFDAVADPSTYQAFQKKVTKENYNYDNFSAKNESRRIHSVNKDAVIACLGGLIKNKTSNIIGRL